MMKAIFTQIISLKGASGSFLIYIDLSWHTAKPDWHLKPMAEQFWMRR
jgi:hypothetical protein